MECDFGMPCNSSSVETTDLVVRVHSVSGAELCVEVAATAPLRELKQRVCTAWAMNPYTHRLLLGTKLLEKDDELISEALGAAVPGGDASCREVELTCVRSLWLPLPPRAA
mmetsp:Transcript_107212/g.303201  ORF Transcript_107212/g.303201 Transcript_107212/m.303201 type:complete len:111 (+) Transcript_107212:83-415(+)